MHSRQHPGTLLMSQRMVFLRNLLPDLDQDCDGYVTSNRCSVRFRSGDQDSQSVASMPSSSKELPTLSGCMKSGMALSFTRRNPGPAPPRRSDSRSEDFITCFGHSQAEVDILSADIIIMEVIPAETETFLFTDKILFVARNTSLDEISLALKSQEVSCCRTN